MHNCMQSCCIYVEEDAMTDLHGNARNYVREIKCGGW